METATMLERATVNISLESYRYTYLLGAENCKRDQKSRGVYENLIKLGKNL